MEDQIDLDALLADDGDFGIILADEETEQFFDDIYRETFQDYFLQLIFKHLLDQ